MCILVSGTRPVGILQLFGEKGRRKGFGLGDSFIIILFEVNLLSGNAPCDNEMLSDLIVPSTL